MAKESFMLVSLKEDKAKKLAQVMGSPTCTRILDYLAGKDTSEPRIRRDNANPGSNTQYHDGCSETQIAQDLGLPLSTVHYNVQQLVAAKLVVTDEFHYSEKGREVNHYKLANKYIIIAPKEDDSFLQHLKKYIPATVIVGAVAIGIKALNVFTGTVDTAVPSTMLEAAPMAAVASEAEVADVAVQTAVPDIAAKTVDGAVDVAAADAPMMARALDAVNATGGELANETLNAFIDQGIPDVVATTPTVATQTAASPHWWQTPAVDAFLIGAAFVIAVILVVEAINWWRSKR